jgi:hypothetical protein
MSAAAVLVRDTLPVTFRSMSHSFRLQSVIAMLKITVSAMCYTFRRSLDALLVRVLNVKRGHKAESHVELFKNSGD